MIPCPDCGNPFKPEQSALSTTGMTVRCPACRAHRAEGKRIWKRLRATKATKPRPVSHGWHRLPATCPVCRAPVLQCRCTGDDDWARQDYAEKFLAEQGTGSE